MSWGGPCIWRRTQDAPSSTLARTHQGRRKQFPIQKQLVSFLLASSLSAPASTRNTNSLRSLNEPICHRRRVLFVREGGGLDPDLSAPNNYIKVRLHWEATSQDNKKRKERASESSQVWGSAALLRGQLPPSRSLLFRHPSFTHPTLCWAAIWEAPACTGAPLPSVCWETRQGREFTQHCALQALLGGEGGPTGPRRSADVQRKRRYTPTRPLPHKETSDNSDKRKIRRGRSNLQLLCIKILTTEWKGHRWEIFIKANIQQGINI